MRMLWRSILSAILLATLAQSSPLQKSRVENGSNGFISSDSNENGYSLPKSVQPDSYVIKLEPHLVKNDFTFNGESNINIIINNPATKTIVLHAVDLEIEKQFTSLVTIDRRATLKPTKQSLDAVKEFLIIEFADPIAAGAYRLNLRYTGKLNEDPKGFYRIKRQIDGHDVWEALTQFKNSYARRAFPCFDERAMTARFSIWIKRPENYVVNSTALAVKRADDGDKSLTHFISSGLVSTADVDFKVVYDLKSWGVYTSTEDPWITTEDPWITTEDPWITTEDLWITTEDPWISTEDPWITTDDPWISTVDPWITTNDPWITTEDPWITTEDPWITTKDPELGYTSGTDSGLEYTSTTDSWWENTATSEMNPPTNTTTNPPTSTTTNTSPIPPTNTTTNTQKCVHLTYLFTCTQCQNVINISPP